jgi:glycosyltransferase involved in cell wall biosynthesis
LKKARLVYLLHDIQVGGVEIALVSAIPALYQNFDLKVIVLGKIDQKMIGDLSEDERACFKNFAYPLYAYPILLFAMAYYVIRLNPKVMIGSLWRASLLGVLVKFLYPRVRFISFVHSTKFFHRFDRLCTKAALLSADEIFTDSTATTLFVRDQVKRDIEITTISFFINPSPAQKTNPPIEGKIRFMFLGRLNKVKNLTRTIDAMKYLTDRGIDISLDLYGPDDGMLKTVLEHVRTNQMESAVKYQGEANARQKRTAFGEHHFLIQLSSHEGMAMSVAEAMQHGVVFFVTPVGEIRNYARDMETAVFADIWDDSGWKKSLENIVHLISNPTQYEHISNNCFHQFQYKEIFSSSLTKAIAAHI